jgi:hypothetical protein
MFMISETTVNFNPKIPAVSYSKFWPLDQNRRDQTLTHALFMHIITSKNSTNFFWEK